MIHLRVLLEPPEGSCLVSIDRDGTFHDLLINLRNVLRNSACWGFAYVDDDGDRITVNEDEDFINFKEEIFNHTNETTQEHEIKIYPITETEEDSGSLLTISTASDNNSITNICSSSDLSSAGSSSLCNINSVRLESLLGCGRSAQVYRAIDRKSGRLLAVKRMQINMADDENKEFEIMAELEILRTCQSPFIIGFYGAFEFDSNMHICVEYMDALSLDRYGIIQNEAVLCCICVAIVRGLHCLWLGGVMHRDLKPSNILLNRRGEVKLADFNISTRMARSIAHTFIGTYLYMAPERITEPEYRYSADVWSLGVCLYELSCGTLPFLQDNDQVDLLSMDEIMQRIVQYRQPRPLPQQYSRAFGSFVHHCLRRLPQERISLNDLLIADWLAEFMSEDEKRLKIVADWLSLVAPTTPTLLDNG